jgi:hypothetical protein
MGQAGKPDLAEQRGRRCLTGNYAEPHLPTTSRRPDQRSAQAGSAQRQTLNEIKAPPNRTFGLASGRYWSDSCQGRRRVTIQQTPTMMLQLAMQSTTSIP